MQRSCSRRCTTFTMLHDAIAEQDVQEGKGTIVQVAGHTMALFNISGKIHAIDNSCPHKQGPLGEGELEDCIVTCPRHGWQFDVRTGEGITMPLSPVKTYAVTVENGRVLVDI